MRVRNESGQKSGREVILLMQDHGQGLGRLSRVTCRLGNCKGLALFVSNFVTNSEQEAVTICPLLFVRQRPVSLISAISGREKAGERRRVDGGPN